MKTINVSIEKFVNQIVFTYFFVKDEAAKDATFRVLQTLVDEDTYETISAMAAEEITKREEARKEAMA